MSAGVTILKCIYRIADMHTMPKGIRCKSIGESLAYLTNGQFPSFNGR